MGLINGSLQIGRSALQAHQAAMQVIGNNIANAGNSDYTRQTARLIPLQGAQLAGGYDAGGGVKLAGVERQIDVALEQRLRQAISDRSKDNQISSTLSRVETLYNEMTDEDLSSRLSEFFNAFSQLQSTPQDVSARSVVTQVAGSLVDQLQTLRKDIINVYNETTDTLVETVDQINALTKQIADLNVKIANAHSGGDPAGALLDQRDSLLKDLSGLIDINVVESETGTATVYIGSDPLIQANQARELQVNKEAQGDIIHPEITFVDNGREVAVSGGKAGAIEELINTLLHDNLDQLDTLAAGLIFEVNKIHSSGQGLVGYSEITSTNVVTDPDAALNQAGLAFTPKNGSFLVTVLDKNTGQQTVHQINVDLSGLGASSTLNSVAAQLSAVPNLTAQVLPDGKLRIGAASDNYTFTFSEDSSNFLAAAGINGFFTGTDAGSIAVNPDLLEDPQLVACSQSNLPGDGSNAAAIAGLRTSGAESLNGLSITDYYRALVGEVGTRTAGAAQQLEVHAAIADTLQAQRESVSGVSLDEETINLLSNQRAFQGAAKYVSVVNEMLQVIMQMV